MCFGGWLIQHLGNDLRSPIMCFDFTGPENVGGMFLFQNSFIIYSPDP